MYTSTASNKATSVRYKGDSSQSFWPPLQRLKVKKTEHITSSWTVGTSALHATGAGEEPEFVYMCIKRVLCGLQAQRGSAERGTWLNREV